MDSRISYAALAAILCAPHALAQEPAPASAPAVTSAPADPAQPPPQLAELAAFAGRWKCEGTIPAVESTPAQSTRASLTIASDLDRFWYSGREVRERTKADPRAITRQFFWTFDPAMRQFVGGWLDSRGGWLTHTSPGWQKEALVFVGHIMSGPARRAARETFTRPDARGFTRTFEVLNELTWVKVAEETCRK
jgi:hypothetical protein